jgi:hypothetical protein
MSWTAPMTAVAGSVFTAAQFNTFVRDNLLECPSAKATTPGSHFVTNATNQVAERVASGTAVFTTETTTSTAYTDLATVGPVITVSTGSNALICISASIQNDGTGSSRMAYDVSGATTEAPADNRGIAHFGTANGGGVIGNPIWDPSLTPGVNTFTAKYRVSAGTGTFLSRRLAVIPF